MFSFRLVFLAMGISMTLSTAALGGGSPNDKMDTILSVVYSMRDRMDNLVSKVGNMESKVNDIDNMEEITAEKVFFPTFFPSFSFQSFLYILNKNTPTFEAVYYLTSCINCFVLELHC